MKKILSHSLLIFFIGAPVFSLKAQVNPGDKKPTINETYAKEIAVLSRRPEIQNAFKIIVSLEPETIRNTITLTEIPAPPFKEQKRAEKFRQMLKEADADSVWMDETGNVIALKKGISQKKTVVIEGHLDTVFPEETDVKVKQRGDTLFAPGIGDDSRGLAVVLTLLKSIHMAKLKTEADILFIGTVGEEGLGDLRGVKALFDSKSFKIDSYISLDMEGLDHVVNGGTGSLRYRITFKGPGGHSYSAFGNANPHNALAGTIQSFVKDADSFTKQGVPTTYNIGVIGGGSSVNAIPMESWMEVDLRSEDPSRLKVLDGILRKAVQQGLDDENNLKRKDPSLTVEVKLIGNRPAGIQQPSMPLVQRAMASVKSLGATPKLAVVSTNANLAISLGVPAITIGVGGQGDGAHSINEWWRNDKGFLAIQNALLILLAEAGYKK